MVLVNATVVSSNAKLRPKISFYVVCALDVT